MFSMYYIRYACPISIARHLMEHSSHNILVGDGARKYAERNGFAFEDNSNLLPAEFKNCDQVSIVVRY